MKNKYIELKERHEKMVNEFPMALAFSDKQFEEAKKKLGVTEDSELVRTSVGGIIRKTDSKAYTELFQLINTQDEEAMKDDDYLYHGFVCELANHEFSYTYDPTDTLDCFGLTIDELNANERLLSIFNKAKTKYLVSNDSY